jgi:hypothetical protein
VDTAEAKLTHQAVRQNLERFAQTGSTTLSTYAISADTFCALGEWLRIEKKHGRNETLHRLHREFHDRAGKVVRLIASKQMEAATSMLDREFTAVEDDLMSALDDLQIHAQ